MASVTWDYFKNYAWTDVGTTMFAVVSDFNHFINILNELDSDVDRLDWVRRNYATLLNLSNSLFNRLLKVFTHSVRLLFLFLGQLIIFSQVNIHIDYYYYIGVFRIAY